RLLQVDERQKDLLGVLPGLLLNLTQGEHLVGRAATWPEATLFLGHPRFDDSSNFGLQNFCVELPRKTQECDSTIVVALRLVAFLEDRHHDASLPVHWHLAAVPGHLENSR